jgi:hypothetical protein
VFKNAQVLKARREAANILNKQWQAANKGWSSSLMAGRGANIITPKCNFVTECYKGNVMFKGRGGCILLGAVMGCIWGCVLFIIMMDIFLLLRRIWDYVYMQIYLSFVNFVCLNCTCGIIGVYLVNDLYFKF